MPGKSDHLEDIIENRQGSARVQCVFVDVVSYSKRRTPTQLAVVEPFIECCRQALVETAKLYVKCSQANRKHLKTDVITIPTGDGAAIVFPLRVCTTSI